MLSVYSDDHRLHFGQSELVDGKLQPCFEMPSRADTVLARVKSQNLGEVIAPKDFGREPLLRIHDAAYLDFLQGAWARWTAEGHSGDLVSTTFPGRRLRRDGPIPTALMGELGYYSFDTEAPITAGTWQAIYSSAQVALTAQEHMRQGARNAFALCRPPGHHAGGDFMGGYCFLNNAAIVSQAFLDQGAKRVAILDVDYHHGNGTQAIYYRRDDVLSISLHQDGCFPPGYSGAEDIGEDRGRGFNLNVPLLPGGGHDAYMQAMQRIVLPALERFRPQLIVVASGFDANAVDPLARMQLHSDSFRAMTAMVRDAAERHAGGRLVVVHEGGYSEAYVPFCGLAVIEELSGVRSAVRDPLRDFIELQQPNAAFRDFQRQRLEELAAQFGLCPAQPLQAAR